MRYCSSMCMRNWSSIDVRGRSPTRSFQIWWPAWRVLSRSLARTFDSSSVLLPPRRVAAGEVMGAGVDSLLAGGLSLGGEGGGVASRLWGGREPGWDGL